MHQLVKEAACQKQRRVLEDADAEHNISIIGMHGFCVLRQIIEHVCISVSPLAKWENDPYLGINE